ncbi:hypothetical protein [Bradyrhizobium sp. USDA 3262]
MDLIKAQIQKYPFLRNYFQPDRKKLARTTKQVVCRFIGDFKVGDNLVRNADALCRLSALNENGVFNKLIVVQTGSIVEAALHEIIYRAQNFTREGVPNITKADRDELATKNVELFNNIINVMKKYDILKGLGADIYDELHKLRKYRNKVHIQTDVDIKDVPRDENAAFSAKTVVWALEFAVRVLNHLNEKFSRPKELELFAHSLSIPLA